MQQQVWDQYEYVCKFSRKLIAYLQGICITKNILLAIDRSSLKIIIITLPCIEENNINLNSAFLYFLFFFLRVLLWTHSVITASDIQTVRFFCMSNDLLRKSVLVILEHFVTQFCFLNVHSDSVYKNVAYCDYTVRFLKVIPVIIKHIVVLSHI